MALKVNHERGVGRGARRRTGLVHSPATGVRAGDGETAAVALRLKDLLCMLY